MDVFLSVFINIIYNYIEKIQKIEKLLYILYNGIQNYK